MDLEHQRFLLSLNKFPDEFQITYRKIYFDDSANGNKFEL